MVHLHKLRKYFNEFKSIFFKIVITTVVFLFFGIGFYFEQAFCVEPKELGILKKGVYNGWKYFYYSNKQQIHFEEILNFYFKNSQDVDFRMSNYFFDGQKKYKFYRYWGHWNLTPVNFLQPYNEILFNIMITDSNKFIISDINPTLMKLTDKGFLNGNIHYNSNYAIFIDRELAIERLDLYEKNKIDQKEFLSCHKQAILDNFNAVLKNYKK